MSDIVERLRDHATDWNGAQMPDLEPAKGDPTAGMLREAAAELTRLRADLSAAQRERDEWRAEAERTAAEARDCFEAQSEIDEAWNAIGTRGNRETLTLSEQVASLCRELDDGSFYKEADIDRLMAERDAAQEREQRMREALANIMGNMEPDPDDPDRRRMLSNGFARWEALEDDARAALENPHG